MQYIFFILYIIVSGIFAYIKINYIEAAYYMVKNSALYSVFMPFAVILPLGLLFGKFVFDCRLNGRKIVRLVENTMVFIVCILGYRFVGLHHPELIYYILYLATEELMVVIFTFVKK